MHRSTHFVPPQQFVAVPVLKTVPDVEELCYPMLAYMIGVLLCAVPVERCSKRKQAHDEMGTMGAEEKVNASFMF